MKIEILLVLGILLFIVLYNNKKEFQKFIVGEDSALNFLREKDYNFYVLAKYGENADPNLLYSSRLRTTGYAAILLLMFFITDLTAMNIVFIIGGIFLIYKMPYFNLKSYYKKYMSQVDQMLPYYLKGLEILCQNYTVPVALSRSVEDAPEIFKPGLRKLIDRINAGDSTIDPYMEFANTYPVRDSMRMMRLLYRLGLGTQEKKQERLMMFSRTVSTLQNKARETKYKERLGFMESQTMVMLVVTGVGVMLIILISMMMMFSM